jgi:carbon-monoxide dehydrogenase medium subunit
MKPPPFRYVAARTVEDAVSALAEGGPDAKLLAGGQSLVPMLNFRLLEPAVLVDINGLGELDYIREDGGSIRIGALTRHRTVETSPIIRSRVPVLAEAMTHVAHFAIRNRGTFGGSLSHADPAAEIPLVARLLDARIRTRTTDGGREIAAAVFFAGALTTVLEPAELVTEVVLPIIPGSAGCAFEEVSRRPGDFAVAMVGAVVTLERGRCREARIAMGGVGQTPLRAVAAEALLAGEPFDAGLIAAAASSASDAADPSGDLHGSADYRRHLVGVLVRRALAKAAARAGGGRR